MSSLFLSACTQERAHDEAVSTQPAPLLAISDPNAVLPVVLPDVQDPMFTSLTIPSDAPLRGMWSATKDWPLNGLHSALLPNGRVLTYGTPAGNAATQDGRTFDIWDPAQGFTTASHRTTYNAQQVNSFCSSAQFLSDGTLLVSGGNGPLDSSVFSPATGAVATSPHKLADDRWYGTMITLPDGRPLMLGGSGPYAALRAYQDPAQAVNAGSVSMTPEIYEPGTGFRSLFGAYSREAFGPDFHRYWYPRAWVAPNGEVFGISSEKMWYLDYSGSGSVRVAGNFKTGVDANTRPNIGPTSTAVMFAPGRILQVGGNGYHDGHATPSSALATVVDINGATPVVTETNPMSNARQWPNATVLPDGKVVVTGGTRYSNNGGSDAVYAAELWDPTTGSWTVGASAAQIRVYHSAAILMPNATVLSTGGGAPGPVNNLNAEVYYPPYLFRAGAAGAAELAPRPRMTAVSTLSLDYGQPLEAQLASDAPIQRAVLIGASSVTHSFNTFQRRLELELVQAGNRLAVAMPQSGVEAPPGYYELFVLDASGVPSTAVLLSLGEGVAAPPVSTLLPRGNEITLMSLNVADSAIATDAQALGVLKALGPSPSDADLLATRFIVRDGLSDSNCVSLEPVSAPGKWLRHYGYRLRLDTSEASDLFKADATFCPELGLSGTGISLRSKNYPTRLVRHTNGELWIDPETTGGTFAADASFRLRQGALPTLPAVNAPIVTVGSVASYAPAISLAGAEFSWDFGDGSAPVGPSASPTVSHTYTTPGVFLVTLTVRLSDGRTVTKTFVQAVSALAATGSARTSSATVLEVRPSGARLWVANPDNDSVTVFDAQTLTRVREIAVGASPHSVAVAPNGQLWVVNRGAATISVVDATSLVVTQTLSLPAASRPHGLVFAANAAYVSLDALGAVLELDASTGALTESLDVGANPRGLAVTPDGARLLVSRFISPPIPGEASATPALSQARAEVRVIDLPTLGSSRLAALRHSDKTDGSVQGRGIPNYLGAPVVSPDGKSAWIPSKQDNIARGTLRDGQNLDFQNTVRAVTSYLDLATETEQLERRVDHDNAGVASAAIFHPSGVYLFVSLETSRQVAVVNAFNGSELFRIEVGRAPQGLALSPDGARLFVQNFMDRSVSVIDLGPLVGSGEFQTLALATLSSVESERLTSNVLLGKQLFYDARDPRLARDAYLSCASCHSDGADDGRVWDLTGMGEGLRNTISLVGRAGGRGLLHWSANFDEVQDFEGQIRALAGGTGLMLDATFQAGTRSQPLGDPKSGLSPDLDALAAYLASLTTATPSPFRSAPTQGNASAGRAAFEARGCVSCHYGSTFSDETGGSLRDIGTLKPSSGKRLSGLLTGIEVPTLRDAWATAPYLHDGSALTLSDAILAHQGVSVGTAELSDLAAFVQQIDGAEPALPTCQDGIKNGAEPDVDCGGSCSTACANGKACLIAADCSSGLCNAGLCVAQPTCTDGVKNGAETDVDCGGSCASDCANGKACLVAADCSSGLCNAGLCAAQPTCTDGVKNGSETGVDCGGTCAACPTCAAATYEAETMYHSTGGSVSGGWNIWSNGYVSTQHAFSQGAATLTVYASGSLAANVWPNMRVSVGGTVIGNVSVNTTSFAPYVFNFTAPASSAEIRIEFTNDYYVSGADRNLYVDKVAVGCGSAPAPTCSDGVKNGSETGVDCGGSCAACCVPATYEAETMTRSTGGAVSGGWNIWSNGYVSTQHTFTQGLKTITVYASGSLAANVWPNLRLSVGGTVIGNVTVNTTSFAPYSFTLTTNAGAAEIRVEFTNDYYVSGADRNLYVDRVVVGCGG